MQHQVALDSLDYLVCSVACVLPSANHISIRFAFHIVIFYFVLREMGGGRVCQITQFGCLCIYKLSRFVFLS